MTENQNIEKLIVAGKEIILVGTAHVSKDSATLVSEVIGSEKPDTVCVELCESRYQSIRQKDRWQEMDIFKVIKEKKALLLLSNLILASFQKRIAEKFDIRPGEEMIRAIEAADACNAQIHLADREIRVTLMRTWRSIGLWDKCKVLFQLLWSLVGELDDLSEEDIEKMKQQDILESMLAEMGQSFPALKTILIDERDRYLAYHIRTAPGNKIVAVVGAGHVPGIRQYLNTEIDIEPLKQIPDGGKFGSFMQWGFPAAIVLLVIAGFFSGGASIGTDMVVMWTLLTAIMAGLGALAALAHPLTIAASMIAAPFTTLHPLIAAGWVSGLVEAFSRKPKVKDFESLSQDILSIKGFWKNKVTRILLVVAFTNIGASIGVFAAVPMMLKLLK
jgi:pheromone shutdown-related protein TraB